jgi:hypothetical protein
MVKAIQVPEDALSIWKLLPICVLFGLGLNYLALGLQYGSLPGLLGFPIQPAHQANYSRDSLTLVFPAVDPAIIGDALNDRGLSAVGISPLVDTGDPDSLDLPTATAGPSQATATPAPPTQAPAGISATPPPLIPTLPPPTQVLGPVLTVVPPPTEVLGPVLTLVPAPTSILGPVLTLLP